MEPLKGERQKAHPESQLPSQDEDQFLKTSILKTFILETFILKTLVLKTSILKISILKTFRVDKASGIAREPRAVQVSEGEVWIVRKVIKELVADSSAA